MDSLVVTRRNGREVHLRAHAMCSRGLASRSSRRIPRGRSPPGFRPEASLPVCCRIVLAAELSRWRGGLSRYGRGVQELGGELGVVPEDPDDARREAILAVEWFPLVFFEPVGCQVQNRSGQTEILCVQGDMAGWGGEAAQRKTVLCEEIDATHRSRHVVVLDCVPGGLAKR